MRSETSRASRSAAHSVREGDEEAPLVDLQDGVGVAAAVLALFGPRGDAERRIKFRPPFEDETGAPFIEPIFSASASGTPRAALATEHNFLAFTVCGRVRLTVMEFPSP